MFEIWGIGFITPQQVVPIIPMSIRIRQFFALYPGASQPLEATSGSAELRSEFLTFQSQQETQLPEDDPRYVASPEVVCISEKPGEGRRQEPKAPRGSIVEKPQQPEGVSGGLTAQVDVEAQARVRKSIELAEKKKSLKRRPVLREKHRPKKGQVPQEMQLPKRKLRVQPRRT